MGLNINLQKCKHRLVVDWLVSVDLVCGTTEDTLQVLSPLNGCSLWVCSNANQNRPIFPSSESQISLMGSSLLALDRSTQTSKALSKAC